MPHNTQIKRLASLLVTASLILTLLWLDQARGGPASLMSRCNLLLTRSESPAAEILIIGSSRSGTAIDAVAMQNMFQHTDLNPAPQVDRIAIPNNILRLSYSLLQNYLQKRGRPQVIVLEVMYQTQRTLDRLSQGKPGIRPEHDLFERELNLRSFRQLLTLPSLAMPFTEEEGLVNLWRFKLKGVMQRSGALLYQFIKNPTAAWTLQVCDKNAWTREPSWPADFALSHGDFYAEQSPVESLKILSENLNKESRLRAEITQKTHTSYIGIDKDKIGYPFEFHAPYRHGELKLLTSIVDLTQSYQIPLVLLPLPLYGHTVKARDLTYLKSLAQERLYALDLYKQAPTNLDNFWYDDAHLDTRTAGAITTSTLAQYLLETVLSDEPIMQKTQ